MQGWIKLHRKTLESKIFTQPNVLKFWLWILLKASHCEYEQMVGLQTISLKSSEFVFGRKQASKELKMSESKVYRILKLFESENMIGIKSSNKFSIINVVNWEFYQCEGLNFEQQTDNKQTTDEQLSNSKRTSDEQQTNTNKNVKNLKNENNLNNGKNDNNLINKKSEAVEDFFTHYSKICFNLPKVENLTEARITAIEILLTQMSTEKIYRAFEKINNSTFCQGFNKNGWKATIDFCSKVDNLTKALEGKYDEKIKYVNDRENDKSRNQYEKSLDTMKEWLEDGGETGD